MGGGFSGVVCSFLADCQCPFCDFEGVFCLRLFSKSSGQATLIGERVGSGRPPFVGSRHGTRGMHAFRNKIEEGGKKKNANLGRARDYGVRNRAPCCGQHGHKRHGDLYSACTPYIRSRHTVGAKQVQSRCKAGAKSMFLLINNEKERATGGQRALPAPAAACLASGLCFPSYSELPWSPTRNAESSQPFACSSAHFALAGRHWSQYNASSVGFRAP